MFLDRAGRLHAILVHLKGIVLARTLMPDRVCVVQLLAVVAPYHL